MMVHHENPEILRQCVIDALIPITKTFTLESLLNSAQFSTAEDDSASLATKVPQREALFLDERILTCVVLRCPLIPEQALKDLLSSISITVEAYAVGTKQGAQGHDAPKAGAKELVDSHLIENAEDPIVAVGSDSNANASDDEENGHQFIYVMWKRELHLDRSNVRSGNPSLYLSTSAKIQPIPTSSNEDDEYMVPYQAESVNLFHALQHDPSFVGRQPPILSAARLAKHTPPGPATRDQPRPLKNLTRTLHRLLPVVNTRLRCTKLGGSPHKASSPTKILASISVELSPGSSIPLDEPRIHLDRLDVSLQRGEACPIPGVELPRPSYPGDVISFVYDLLPNAELREAEPDNSSSSRRPHTLNLTLHARINPPSTDLANSLIILTTWRTTLDLSPLYKPFPKPPTQPVTITIESAPGPVKLNSALKWTISVANTSTSPPRSMRLKLIPALGDSPNLIALQPYLMTPELKSGTSTTLELEFLVVEEGALTPPELRVVEIDDRGEKVEGVDAVIREGQLPNAVAARD